MKKIILFAFLALLLITSCSDKRAYTLTGKFATSEFDGKTVYLQKANYNMDQLPLLDSAVVKDGQFVFKRTAPDTSAVHLVVFSDQHIPMIFIAEPGKIELAVDSAYMIRASGTPQNDEYQQAMDKINKMTSDIQESFIAIEIELNEGKITPDELAEKREARIEEFKVKLLDMIKPNIKSPAGEFIFLNYYYLLPNERVSELISMLNPEFKSTQAVQKIEKAIISSEATSAGKPFIDIRGKSPDGKDVALSDYAGKGKIVLLDFWASWCGPCIRSLPNVVAAYQKYKDKGFEIVGVSLDEDLDKWKNASEKHQVTWPQFSNLKGWNDEAAKAYGVNSIPATFLIDKDGKIIEKNIEGESLSEKLEGLLK